MVFAFCLLIRFFVCCLFNRSGGGGHSRISDLSEIERSTGFHVEDALNQSMCSFFSSLYFVFWRRGMECASASSFRNVLDGRCCYFRIEVGQSACRYFFLSAGCELKDCTTLSLLLFVGKW